MNTGQRQTICVIYVYMSAVLKNSESCVGTDSEVSHTEQFMGNTRPVGSGVFLASPILLHIHI